MAMNLRLTDEETEALRRTAEAEGRSMQETARAAIHQYTTRRAIKLSDFIGKVLVQDAEALKRLGS
jgi:hypothetical protein